MDSEEKPFWLPEYEVNLTSFELGYLLATVYGAENDVPVNVPGEDGKPIPSTIKKAIIRKLSKVADQFYKDEDDG